MCAVKGWRFPAVATVTDFFNSIGRPVSDGRRRPLAESCARAGDARLPVDIIISRPATLLRKAETALDFVQPAG